MPCSLETFEPFHPTYSLFCTNSCQIINSQFVILCSRELCLNTVLTNCLPHASDLLENENCDCRGEKLVLEKDKVRQCKGTLKVYPSKSSSGILLKVPLPNEYLVKATERDPDNLGLKIGLTLGFLMVSAVAVLSYSRWITSSTPLTALCNRLGRLDRL